MNVSSVKNLNGETFSAVQDATLTDVVQSNSAQWGQGGEFPISADEAVQYVQTNSAGIDETVTAFQTNSSTYMVEPNLEYNAVGEISGYGNSAIAQYGAEKQWLVHDDTIVHIANSAQYAFGCNISALQRLMGIDETVLWSGTPSTSINLAEQFSNFETIKITANAQEQNTKMAQTFEFPGTNSAFDLHIYSYNSNANSVVNYLTRYNVNGLIFSASTINHWWQLTGSITAGTWQGPGSSPIVPTKVVGVHRISG